MIKEETSRYDISQICVTTGIWATSSNKEYIRNILQKSRAISKIFKLFAPKYISTYNQKSFYSKIINIHDWNINIQFCNSFMNTYSNFLPFRKISISRRKLFKNTQTHFLSSKYILYIRKYILSIYTSQNFGQKIHLLYFKTNDIFIRKKG